MHSSWRLQGVSPANILWGRWTPLIYRTTAYLQLIQPIMNKEIAMKEKEIDSWIPTSNSSIQSHASINIT